MITSPLLYLLIIAAIGTFFGYLKQKSSFKVFSSHLVAVPLIFFLTALLSYLGVFAHTQEINRLYTVVTNNLFPAMVFLFFIDIDLKNLLKGSALGCSCSIGPKRYWLILGLSFFVSFLCQFISLHVSFIDRHLAAVNVAAFFGMFASFTPIKNINGIKDIATTMLYLLSALFGSMMEI
ncbi:DUF819 family protein [bacterium]|nr:DUF819 family protein [bacterium]MBU1884275.1 DUF819 family protein [bacterium]